MWSSFFIYMFDFLVLCPRVEGGLGGGGREPKKLWIFGRVRKHYGDFRPWVCQNYTEKSISKFSLGRSFFWIFFFFSLTSGPPSGVGWFDGLLCFGFGFGWWVFFCLGCGWWWDLCVNFCFRGADGEYVGLYFRQGSRLRTFFNFGLFFENPRQERCLPGEVTEANFWLPGPRGAGLGAFFPYFSLFFF